MRYMQLRVKENEFIKIKKAALDAGMSTEKFLKLAALEKSISDTALTLEELTSTKTGEVKV